MSKIKAVIFDLGRVLIDVDADSLNRIFGIESNNGNSAMNIYIGNDFIRSFESGSITPEQFYRKAFDTGSVNIEYEQFLCSYSGVFAPIPGSEELVKRVSEKVPIGLLSDTNAIHWPRILIQFPWLSIFDNLTLSYQTGILKPDPRAYQTAADSVGVEIASCLFIDDLERNVKGAIDAGMTAIRFEGVENLTAQLDEFFFNA